MFAGKDVLPSPFAVGAGELASDRIRQMNRSEAVREIALVQALDAREPRRHRGSHDSGKRNDAVLSALRVTDDDAIVSELEILDAQAKSLEQTHAGSVEERREEARRAFHVSDDAADLGAREDGRKAARPLGADDDVEIGQLFRQDVAIEKEERRQRLGLVDAPTPSATARCVTNALISASPISMGWRFL